MDRKIIRCPLHDCRAKILYDVSGGWPDYCPVCKGHIAHDRDDDDVVVPNFLSLKTKKTDDVARQIMDGSETRAELAAAMAGVPVSEMNDLKITDLNDRRDSEIAAKPVVNDITRHMDTMRARGMKAGFGGAVDTSSIASGTVTVNGQTISGVTPRAGTRANEQIKSRITSFRTR